METFLINLIRGGGYSALNSFPVYRNNIFRPLLTFTQNEMKIILEIENWNIYIDESNQSNIYLRNRIRNTILPLLKEEGLNSKKIHDNFHNFESISPIDDNLGKNEYIPSYIKIDKLSLTNINLGKLKQLLDIYLSILKLHPINKNLIEELLKELKKNSSFEIENKEVIFSKNPSSDLYILPHNSPALLEFQLTQNAEFQTIKWNSKSKTISKEFFIDHYKFGSKIQRNGFHTEISELYRKNQIPRRVRAYIPIVFKKEKPCAILFSLWDDRIKDFMGDFYNEKH